MPTRPGIPGGAGRTSGGSGEHGSRPGRVLLRRPEHARERFVDLPPNTPPPYGKARFPDVAVYDNVSLQKLVAEHFGIESLALVTGWSVGAGQTYQWAVFAFYRGSTEPRTLVGPP